MLQQLAVLVRWKTLVAVMYDVTAVCCIRVMDSLSGCDE